MFVCREVDIKRGGVDGDTLLELGSSIMPAMAYGNVGSNGLGGQGRLTRMGIQSSSSMFRYGRDKHSPDALR